MSSGTTIQFETPVGQAAGYLTGKGANRPGVVVIQEWWGLVPHIMDVADRLAAEGYTALAPDLYHGKSTVDAEEASHLMQGLDWTRAVAELAGAVAHLKKRESCRAVGVTGFCMGGALTVLAAQDRDVKAYAAFYGLPPNSEKLAPIDAPGLLVFGEHENFFSVPAARAFVEAQRARGVATDIVVYPGAGHGFFNDARPEVYKAEAAADAWARTLTLFKANL